MIVNLKGKVTKFEKMVKTELKAIKEGGLKRIVDLLVKFEEEFMEAIKRTQAS